MNENYLNNINNTDENEIERIQEEIRKDLTGGAEPVTVNAAYAEPQPAADAEPQPYGAPASINTEPAAAGAAEPPPYGTPVYARAEQPPAYTQQPAPYTETIKKQKGGRKTFLRTVIAACIIGVIGGPLAGLFIGFGSEFAKQRFGTAAEESQASDAPLFSFAVAGENDAEPAPISVAPNASSIIDDFSAIVDKVEPSVVCITSIIETGGESSFFRQSIERPSQGSGIIFNEDGQNIYIVTNHHVVSGANRVGVSISGSEPVPANLVGEDPSADLAVILVPKSALRENGIDSVTVATFGSSEDVKVGEIVLAIGNALGEGNTATLGIVSAVNKEINVEGLQLTVIQTDAAINPGNSGGPLINTKGEVIAINVAKTYSGYGVEGTGYSLPISDAKVIIENLRNRTPKPFIGITMQDLTEEISELYSLPAGVLIVQVSEGSPAEKAGIKRNDVITSFDGKPVFAMEDIQAYVLDYNVGDTVIIKLYRIDEGAVELTLELGEQPAASRF